MRRPKRLIIAALAAWFAVPAAMAADQAAYERAAAEAKTALKTAAGVGGEWRDSAKMLKQAAEAAAKGDFDKAVSLAESARFQGMKGAEQAKGEQNVGNPAYIYD